MNAHSLPADMSVYDPAIEYTVTLVTAYVSRNHVAVADLAGLIASVHAAVGGLGKPVTPAVAKADPAAIRKSITHEALISFEDGKPYKALKRHLTMRGLTPEAYREKWGLPVDYPLVAQAYSDRRSAISLEIGLGRKKPAAVEMAEAV